MQICEYELVVEVDDEFATDTRMTTKFIAPAMKFDQSLAYARVYAAWFYGVSAKVISVTKVLTCAFIEEV